MIPYINFSLLKLLLWFLSSDLTLICNMCQSLQCKYSPHSQFQTRNAVSLNTKLERDSEQYTIIYYFPHLDTNE